MLSFEYIFKYIDTSLKFLVDSQSAYLFPYYLQRELYKLLDENVISFISIPIWKKSSHMENLEFPVLDATKLIR